MVILQSLEGNCQSFLSMNIYIAYANNERSVMSRQCPSWVREMGLSHMSL